MSGLTLNYFYPAQLEWMMESARVKIIEKARRTGISHATAFKAVDDRVGSNPRKRSDLLLSSADQTTAIEFAEDCATFAATFEVGVRVISGDEAYDDGTQATTFTLKFPSGAKIICGSSNPKFFRGKGGDVVLDEFAFHAKANEMWKAAQASAIPWGHQVSVISTHNGRASLFNRMIERAREGKFRATVHRLDIDQAIEQGVHERIRMRNEHLKFVPEPDLAKRAEWRETLRATCVDDSQWQQEFMVNPEADDAASLLSYDLISACEVPNLILAEIEKLPRDGESLYAGFDVARKRDGSALAVLGKVADVFWTRVMRWMQNMPFSVQEGVLNLLLANRRVKRLCIDSTGIGMQMAERLQERWGKYRVEAVNFSAPVKSELAMPLRRLFEDRLVRIPSDDAVREDLHSVKKLITTAGNVRLDADRSDTDGHADRFWALALAYHAADDNKQPLPRPLMERPVGW